MICNINMNNNPNQLTSCQTKQWHILHLHSVMWLKAVLSDAPLIIDPSGRRRSLDLSSGRGERGRGASRGAVSWFGPWPHHLLRVAFRLDQEDVTLGQEDAGQHAKAGSQDGKNLDGDHELAPCAEVSRDKGDPDYEEDQHAEGHTLPLAVRENKKHHALCVC